MMTIPILDTLPFEEAKEWHFSWAKNPIFARRCKSSLTQQFWGLWKEKKSQIKDLGFFIDKDAGIFYLYKKEKPVAKTKTAATVKVEKKIVPPNFTFTTADGLLDYQIEHASVIAAQIARGGRAADGSSTGVGKTYVALAVAKKLGLRPLVICTKSGINTWERVAAKFGVELYGISNWELAKIGKMIKRSVYKRGEKKGLPKIESVSCPAITLVPNPNFGKYKTEKKFNITYDLPDDVILIFDEAHAAKNDDTWNCKILCAARDCGARGIALSATFGETPMNFYALGYFLGLFDTPWEFRGREAKNFTDGWLWHKNCRKITVKSSSDGEFHRVWKYEGGDGMLKIHDEIYGSGKGSRLNAAELIDAGKFPETKVVAEIFDLDSDEAKKLNDFLVRASSKEIVEINERREELAETPLTDRQKDREKAEMIKVQIFADLAAELVEDGNSVVIFLNYRKSIEKACNLLATDCYIDGTVEQGLREKRIDDFNAAHEKIIIVGVKTGGQSISLHDTVGDHPRVSLISPDDSAQAIQQVLGRVWRSGGHYSVQRIIFAAGTVEEQVYENVAAKVLNINTLNDGDLALPLVGGKIYRTSVETTINDKDIVKVSARVVARSDDAAFGAERDEAAREVAAELADVLSVPVTVKEVTTVKTPEVKDASTVKAPEVKKPSGITSDGIYTKDGVIYKVQYPRNGSGYLYAKRFYPETKEFVFEHGLIAKIQDATPLPLDEAKAFGHLYGICCVCGRMLTDEVSIAEGIGPICGKRLGGWLAGGAFSKKKAKKE